MGISIQVSGAALIQVGTGVNGAMEILGYTRDGVSIRYDGHFLDVPTDDAGGEAGPPADIQHLGETAMITLEMTKFDSAVAGRLAARIRNTVAGAFNSPGTLLLSSSGAYSTRVLVYPIDTNQSVNFPTCIIREPIEINKGTKYSQLRFEATAYSAYSGPLANSNTTGHA